MATVRLLPRASLLGETQVLGRGVGIARSSGEVGLLLLLMDLSVSLTWRRSVESRDRITTHLLLGLLLRWLRCSSGGSSSRGRS